MRPDVKILLTALALGLLSGCQSTVPQTIAPGVILPAVPADLPGCFARAFPNIPDRALTTADVVKIIGEAKNLDRAKAACGARAVAWMTAVKNTYDLGKK